MIALVPVVVGGLSDSELSVLRLASDPVVRRVSVKGGVSMEIAFASNASDVAVSLGTEDFGGNGGSTAASKDVLLRFAFSGALEGTGGATLVDNGAFEL